MLVDCCRDLVYIWIDLFEIHGKKISEMRGSMTASEVVTLPVTGRNIRLN